MKFKSILKKEFIIFFCIICIVYFCMPLINHLQSGFNSWLMRKNATGQFEVPINIVYFDEKDIETLGGWPLSRNVYAFLAEKLNSFNVKSIGFYVYWAERTIHQDEDDLLLLSVLEKYNNIIGSFYFKNLNDYSENEIPVNPLQYNLKNIPNDIPLVSNIQSPDSLFLKGNVKFGFINLPMTSNGLIEQAFLYAKCGQSVYPSFNMLLANTYQNPQIDPNITKIQINYKVNIDHLPQLSVREIIHSKPSKELREKLNNSIVILGVISSQLGFSKPTPIEKDMPVIGIHAQIIDNILSGDYLKMFPHFLHPFIFLFVTLSIQCINIRRRIPLLLFLALICCIITPILWNFTIIFQLYAYLITIGFFIITLIGNSFYKQKSEFLKETEKRHELETEFQEKVSNASKLEQEYVMLRQKYMDEIDKIRIELSNIHEEKAKKIKNEYQDIVFTQDSPMVKILAEISRIAETDAPVLIRGESGTGKELIADAIHTKSKRSKEPFITINCGAIPESLFESELFGHVKGAFTGANKSKIGFFEAAHGGTIFLDEISEMSPGMQAKLLRTLQYGTFFRVGATKEIKVDVRILAASNQILEQLIEKRLFRQDLFYRLNVLSVHIPPLRERIVDIPKLLYFFIDRQNIKITTNAMSVLTSYHWPGNIRELQNIATRISLSDEATAVTAEWIQNHLLITNKIKTALEDDILEMFRELNFRNDANVTIAKRLGNLHRSTITEYLRGMTFQFFYDEKYNLTKAKRKFNPIPDKEIDKRLHNKMKRYLNNLSDKIEHNLPWEINLSEIQKHIRKIPKRYHPAVLNIAKAYLQNLWDI
jgi:DNA-binding NtrC family response regulator/CHASE2 domain-containing sensor protein